MLTDFRKHITRGKASILLTLAVLLLPLLCNRAVIAMPMGAAMLDSLKQSIDSLTELLDSLSEEEVFDNWNNVFENDTVYSDSLEVDSVSTKPVGGGLTDVVNYKAQDSLVFSAGNLAWLYGSSQVTYTDIQLDAAKIQLSLDSSLVHATPDVDTITGKLTGKPVFKDNSGEYETRRMSYNFKTAKGFITDVTTQQGEGYVTGGIAKKMADNDIFFENGRYTTCDQTECPHFYLELTKARVRPNKNIVTGPAYLVVADVPLPVAIPFGFFPFTKSYSSGVLMPSYGADQQRGLYLRDGGYYFAINDYVDLALKGEVYTKGSWGLSANTHYAMRYKFKGSMAFSYIVTQTGDKGLPDFSQRKDMKITWSHSQDNRFNPNLQLSANVNYSSSGYNRNNVSTIYTNDLATSQKSSTLNATYRVPNTKWTLSASASIAQRTQDSTLDLTLPQLSVSMTTWYPFKRKQKSGDDKWYEKISMSYNMNMSNKVRTKEDQLGSKNILRDWENGIMHRLPINATFNVLKYINITPSININNRTYSHKTVQRYDATLVNRDGSIGGIAKDTVYGFYNAYDFTSSISAQTKLYGFFKPLWKSRLFAVRHVLTPSISFSYTPDFSEKKYGSWGRYYMPDSTAVGGMREVKYSYFEGYSQGRPGSQRSGSINLTLANNIEAKVRSDKDSSGYKKISIIDNINTGISYNLVADSMRWSPTIPVSATFKWGKNSTMNLNATFDTYLYDYNGKAINKPRWEAGKFPRLMSTGYSWSYSLNNEKLKKLLTGSGDSDDEDEENDFDLDSEDGFIEEDLDPTSIESMQREQEKRNRKAKKKGSGGKYDDDGYLIWTVPWSINFSYTMRYGYKGFNKNTREYDRGLIHSASFNGQISPTKGWNFSFSASYDFELNKITDMTINCTRDMHCWGLTAMLKPMGQFASFNVNIAVKAQMLQDLKYEKTSVSRNNKINWYDD